MKNDPYRVILSCQPGQRPPGSPCSTQMGAPWSYADVTSPTFLPEPGKDAHLHPWQVYYNKNFILVITILGFSLYRLF